LKEQKEKKSSVSRFSSLKNEKVKPSLVVVCIFLLLNSKMIWKQIIKLPLMGHVEPSIVALIVNAILAGIVFYVITNYTN
jgi:hypothetical protein